MKPTLVTADMSYWCVAPAPALREHVQCYWMVEDAPRRKPAPRFHHGEDLLIPDGHSEIVFNRSGVSFERWPLGARQHGEHMLGSYIIGGRSHSVGTHTTEPLRLAGMKLDSRFLRALIGSPLHEFRDATLSLRNLGDQGLLDLEDRVANARGASEIARLFDEFLLSALRRLERAPTAADALLHELRRDRGATPILRWAREARVDSRSLERRFCASTGMTPKQYARVIRFKRAYHALIAPGSKTLTAIDGFYDQSHFSREFRHFTGMAPGARLAGTLLQATDVSDHLLQAEMAGGA